MNRTSFLAQIGLIAAFAMNGSNVFGGDWLSGTYLDPALQRQDLFPFITNNRIPEHRSVYNRPRFMPGLIVQKIEPSSQEAMAWQTNHRNGNYARHAGPYVPLYYYPKPWEAINTRARPDTLRPEEIAPVR